MKKVLKALALTPLICAVNSYAEISLNGFASIVAGQTLSNDETFNGYDNDLDFETESLFAIQVQSNLGEGLGVTAQIIARGEDDWDPDFEWAYVSYDVNDELRVLAGRQRAPLYMYSDYLDVSYAYSWISPPGGVYDLPFDTIDGLGVIYTTEMGEFESTFQAIYGNNNDEDDIFGETIKPDYKDVLGGSLTLVRDWLTLRGGYFQADVTLPLSAIAGLSNGWQQAGFSDIANNVEIEDDSGQFYEFGFQIDYDSYLLVGEYTHRTIDNVPLADENSFYVMAGKRFDSFLVTITYGKDDADLQHLTNDIPYGVSPGLDFLKASTDGLTESTDDDSDYITAGLRWDFHSSAAFKLEYTTFSQDVNGDDDADILKAAIVTVF